VYAVIGLVILSAAYWVFDFVTPTNLSDDIFVKQNVAAAIVAGFFILAVALIIAAAIHG
jgi:uncharacterized membrane protein YjfL (UPF0719 family)